MEYVFCSLFSHFCNYIFDNKNDLDHDESIEFLIFLQYIDLDFRELLNKIIKM